MDIKTLTDWQPIETAPKDGSSFYVWVGDGWNGRGPICRTAWRGYWQNEFLNGSAPSNFTPTHWMPLPPPPSEKKPDPWEYATTDGPRKSWYSADEPPEGDGWIRDTDRGRDGWARFSYHEESCWKRLKTTAE